MKPALRNGLVALVLLWSLGPMAWQLYTSLRSPEALLAGAAGLAQGWTLANYSEVLRGDPPFWRYLLNSTVVGSLSTLLTLALAVPCAYALSRRRGLLRLLVGGGLLAAAVFPYVLLFLALLQVPASSAWPTTCSPSACPMPACRCPWRCCCCRRPSLNCLWNWRRTPCWRASASGSGCAGFCCP
jgi:ABC-type glycerol-3-phosphate transport system permease component